MTRCETGDIVLVHFPFTDLLSAKKRPAVIVSPTEYTSRHGDVVILALTSQDQGDTLLQLRGWREEGLAKPTWAKPLLGTISCDLVVRNIGVVSKMDYPCVNNAMRKAINFSHFE